MSVKETKQVRNLWGCLQKNGESSRQIAQMLIATCDHVSLCVNRTAGTSPAATDQSSAVTTPTFNISSYTFWQPAKADSQHIMEQFRPTKHLIFPKRWLGSKGEERYFRAECRETFSWLHYNVASQDALGYICMNNVRTSQNKLFGSDMMD